jgi:thioredoxin reductase (NADPH)
MRLGLRCVTVDQGDIGGSNLHFPRKKVVMTYPMEIPLYGIVNTREILKEDLLNLWHDILAKTGLEIRTHCRVAHVSRKDGIFEVQTEKEILRLKHVVLAIGRRGTARKLNVPGEELGKVAYSLLEPEHFQNMSVLVVGGDIVLILVEILEAPS